MNNDWVLNEIKLRHFVKKLRHTRISDLPVGQRRQIEALMKTKVLNGEL